VNLISVKHVLQAKEEHLPQFRFKRSDNLSTVFRGKTVETVETFEVVAPDFASAPLWLRIHFTDGTVLEVDRKSILLPRTRRKIMHLKLAWQNHR